MYCIKSQFVIFGYYVLRVRGGFRILGLKRHHVLIIDNLRFFFNKFSEFFAKFLGFAELVYLSLHPPLFHVQSFAEIVVCECLWIVSKS